MAVMDDGRHILCDFENVKLKTFTSSMHFLSSLTLPSPPYSIAVIDEHEVVVSTGKYLHFVNVSTMLIKRSIKFPFMIYGITPCNGKLAVCCYSTPRSVKLIDREGKLFWEVSSEEAGEFYKVFKSPGFITSYKSNHGLKETVICVSDSGEGSLTLLDGSTGAVVAVQNLKGVCPEGITPDAFGNLYMCYTDSSEIAVWCGDLSRNKILLTSNDGMTRRPLAIAFDQRNETLVISNKDKSNGSCNYIDTFKLTFSL